MIISYTDASADDHFHLPGAVEVNCARGGRSSPVMRLLSIEASHNRSISSAVQHENAGSAGAGAANDKDT